MKCNESDKFLVEKRFTFGLDWVMETDDVKKYGELKAKEEFNRIIDMLNKADCKTMIQHIDIGSKK